MGELVIAGGDAPKVFEAAEHAFDSVAFLVGSWIEGVATLPVDLVRNDRQSAAGEKKGAQMIAIIGFVGGERSRRRDGLDESWKQLDVGSLASAQGEDEGTASRVAQGMDLGRSPAAGSTDGLSRLPPFCAPEAAR